VQRGIDVTDVAEDIVDEALRVAWEHRDQFRGESSVCTWVHGCVKNVAKRRLRTLACRLRHEVPELKRPGATEDDEDDAALAVADMAGCDPLPARRVRRSDLLRAWARIEDRILVRMAARRSLTKVLARQPAWLRAAFGRFLAREPLESLATDVGLSTRVLHGKFQAIMHSVLSRLEGDGDGGAHA
jgi:DNA-directed RNA polymerase specialized sigma24 family protein